MDWLYQFLLWVTYQELWNGHSANILGAFWLIALMIMAARRLSWHCSNIGWAQPSHGYKRVLWLFAVLLFGFLFAFLFQIVTDEFVTVPLSLAFGGWSLMVPTLGPFTIWKLIVFKWDSYMLILVYSSVFFLSGVWKFCHFTKKSLIWLIAIIVFASFIYGMGIFYFLNLSGWARIRAFWVSYPPWRILTGFLGASIIKKRGVI